MNIGVKQFKSSFFDAASILKKIDAAERRVLVRFGAFARRRIKSSLKYKKGVSAPGTPPHVHRSTGYTRQKKNPKTGVVTKQASSPLRELVYFAYDAARHSVVVGPAKFKDGTAPAALEHGGSAVVFDRRTNGYRRVEIRKRPFVAPAAEAELPAFQESLRNMVR